MKVMVILAMVSFAFRLAAEEVKTWPDTWSTNDIAFKEAMKRDLSFGIGKGRTQHGAIEAWEDFLRREDSRERRAFAIWRLASLWAYNFDPIERKEKPDMQRAEKLLQQVRELIPEIISNETVNAGTLYASLPGDPAARAARKADVYRWFKTRTREMIVDSTARVSRDGYLVSEQFYGETLTTLPSSSEQKRELVERLLREGEEDLVEQITEFIKWSRDGVAVAALLNKVENVAEPEQLKIWRATKGRSTLHTDVDNVIEDSIKAMGSGTIQRQAPVSTDGLAVTSSTTIAPKATQEHAVKHPVNGIIVASACVLVALAYGIMRIRSRSRAL